MKRVYKHSIPFLNQIKSTALGDQHDTFWNTFFKYCISYHDHWLSHEECLERCMFYKLFVEEGQLEAYTVFEQAMIELFKKLFDMTAVIVMMPADYHNPKSRYVYFQLESFLELEHLLVYALRREGFEQFILPEYQTIITSNFDLTWVVQVIKSQTDILRGLIADSPYIHLLD